MRTLIHIGLPRTASTYLQSELFPKIEGFEFYGVEQCYYSQGFQKLLYQDESLYKPEDLRALIGGSNKNVFLSNELFSGHTLGMNAGNRTQIAKRLKQAFPEAEIIVLLRNQVSILESLYSMAVYSGYHKRPEQFLRWGSDDPRYNPYEINEHLESFLYTALLSTYKELFPKVHIFLFEDFVKNPANFFEHIKRELGVDFSLEIGDTNRKNQSLSKRQLNYLRKVNKAKTLLEWNSLGKRIFRQKVWFGEKVLKGKEKFSFSPDLRTRIKDYYAEDNGLLWQFPELKNSESFKRYYLD